MNLDGPDVGTALILPLLLWDQYHKEHRVESSGLLQGYGKLLNLSVFTSHGLSACLESQPVRTNHIACVVSYSISVLPQVFQQLI